jgi:hypothetical protein
LFGVVKKGRTFTSQTTTIMKKSNNKTQNKVQLPAHLQIMADRWNSNYKNIASNYAKNYSYKITDATPDGYGN